MPAEFREPWNHSGWKSPLRSLSPTVPALPRPPTYPSVTSPGTGTPPSGQPVPKPEHTFHEGIFPHIQSKPPPESSCCTSHPPPPAGAFSQLWRGLGASCPPLLRSCCTSPSQSLAPALLCSLTFLCLFSGGYCCSLACNAENTGAPKNSTEKLPQGLARHAQLNASPAEGFWEP